jgi:hypothetical protein
VSESSAHSSKAKALPVSHDFRSACTERVDEADFMTPTRVIHGTKNATQHLQSVLVVMMDDIKSNIKIWLDDYLLHTKD